MEPHRAHADYQASLRDWQRQAPWWRRFHSLLGLQGRLILSAAMLMSLALGASCIVFVLQTHLQLQDQMGEQSRQLASALAWSCEDSLLADNHEELTLSASNLIKSRNIVFVGYYDAQGKPLVQRSRDPDFKADESSTDHIRPQDLMRVWRKETRLFGQCMEVTAPVIATPGTDAKTLGGSRLLGYVTVGLSDQYEASQARRVNWMVVGVGCLVTALGVPLSYLTVYRIFAPIRQLDAAAKRIINGHLDTRVAIDRPDVIGDLARSFNEMAIRVRQQQQDLEAVNEQLAAANRGLEARIEQRTAQFETANQRLSQEIAEKEDFLRAVSHDLNAPLRNISGMATMLLVKHREKFEEDVIHRLERIKSNVDVETDLINELLELSRIKTRRQKMETVNLEQMIWDLRGLFENDLRSHGIELIVDTELPIIEAERARIRQVFQNLIDNAIKYMGGKSDRQIHIGCNLRPTEAEFYVRDTGLGVEPDDMDKVFFVFRRGKNTAAQNIAGKGVGLASVKSIIETYSGRIWVESVLGQGSSFKFTINGMYVPTRELLAASVAAPASELPRPSAA